MKLNNKNNEPIFIEENDSETNEEYTMAEECIEMEEWILKKDCTYYSNLFFKILLKKAYRNVVLKNIEIVYNICETGKVNIIAKDNRYNYDLYIKNIEDNKKDRSVFAISRYSNYSTYSDSKIFDIDTLEQIKLS